MLLPEVVQDLCRSDSRKAVESPRGTEARVEARPRIQQHVRHVGSQCDRLLLGGCSGLEVFEGLCTKAEVGSGSGSGSGSGFGCGSNGTVKRLRGRGHSGTEASHNGATTSTITTSTKEFAAASSRTASLFRLRRGHGKAGRVWCVATEVISQAADVPFRVSIASGGGAYGAYWPPDCRCLY